MSHQHIPERPLPSADALRGLSGEEFHALGLGGVAYVRQVLVNGQKVFSIHGADGDHMGFAPSRDLAFAAIVQHDLDPLDAH